MVHASTNSIDFGLTRDDHASNHTSDAVHNSRSIVKIQISVNSILEEFEDTKGPIRIRISKKNRQK